MCSVYGLKMAASGIEDGETKTASKIAELRWVVRAEQSSDDSTAGFGNTLHQSARFTI